MDASEKLRQIALERLQSCSKDLDEFWESPAVSEGGGEVVNEADFSWGTDDEDSDADSGGGYRSGESRSRSVSVEAAEIRVAPDSRGALMEEPEPPPSPMANRRVAASGRSSSPVPSPTMASRRSREPAPLPPPSEDSAVVLEVVEEVLEQTPPPPVVSAAEPDPRPSASSKKATVGRSSSPSAKKSHPKTSASKEFKEGKVSKASKGSSKVKAASLPAPKDESVDEVVEPTGKLQASPRSPTKMDGPEPSRKKPTTALLVEDAVSVLEEPSLLSPRASKRLSELGSTRSWEQERSELLEIVRALQQEKCDLQEQLTVKSESIAQLKQTVERLEDAVRLMGGSTVASPSVGASESPASGPAGLRKRALDEIVNTEKNYVEMLRQAIEGYMQPLSRAAVTATEFNVYDVEKLFSNMELIWGLSLEFANALEVRLNVMRGSDAAVGDIFLKLIPMFGIYSKYYRKYDESVELLRRLSGHDEFASFVRILDVKMAAVLRVASAPDLKSYLYRPCQRLFQYAMLLQQLLKYTDPGHADCRNLATANNQLASLLERVNERTRFQRSKRRLKELHGRILGLETVPPNSNRVYVTEGPLARLRAGDDRGMMRSLRDAKRTAGNLLKQTSRTLSRASGASSTSRCYVFLFNDMILLTKRSMQRVGGPAEHEAAASSAEEMAADGEHESEDAEPVFKVLRAVYSRDSRGVAAVAAMEDDAAPAFAIAVRLRSGEPPLTLLCPSELERQRWLRCFEETGFHQDAPDKEDPQESSQSASSPSRGRQRGITQSAMQAMVRSRVSASSSALQSASLGLDSSS